MMLANNKCDLPKVRLKFKTDPCEPEPPEARLSCLEAAPCIFLERLKMSREMQQAFLRYRKLKKHNYLRANIDSRKNVPQTHCKKVDPLPPKNKNATFHRKLEIALQSSFAQGFPERDQECAPRHKLYSLKPKNKDSREELWNGEASDFKPHTVSLKPKKTHGHSLNLHNSAASEESTLELQGLRCQYESEQERRERTMKLLERTKKQMKATRGSSSFLIEAWKEDKIYRGASHYLKNPMIPIHFDQF